MVSMVPGVKPVTASVTRVVHAPDLMAGSVMLRVIDRYCVIAVPPPTVSEPPWMAQEAVMELPSMAPVAVTVPKSFASTGAWRTACTGGWTWS